MTLHQKFVKNILTKVTRISEENVVVISLINVSDVLLYEQIVFCHSFLHRY